MERDNLIDSTPLFNRYRVSKGQLVAKGSSMGSQKATWDANRELKEQTRMDNNSAGTMLSTLFDKSRFPKVTGHGLRKLHSTYLGLGENRVSEPMIARLEGRSIGDSREAYKVYPEEDLIEAYKANYHKICVYGEDSTQELQRLQEKQQATNGELEEIRQQVAEQAQALDLIKQFLLQPQQQSPADHWRTMEALVSSDEVERQQERLAADDLTWRTKVEQEQGTAFASREEWIKHRTALRVEMAERRQT